MKLVNERTERIAAIRSQMDCPREFACSKPNSVICSKVEAIDGMLECVEEYSGDCRFSLPINQTAFCLCPLNRFTHGLSAEGIWIDHLV